MKRHEPPAGANPDLRTRRWREQRAAIDARIAEQGPDFDQPRSAIYSAPAGFEALAEFRRANQHIRSFADMHPAYARAAAARESRAQAFAAQGREVAARESFFIAAQLWAAARWPLFSLDAAHRHCTERLNHCFGEFAPRSAHTVERIDIPFEDGALPACLHLPRTAAKGAPWPVAVLVPGMDNNKEQMVAMYGDRLLERGLAVLAVDGPGQAESITRGIFVTPSNHEAAGRAVLAWLQRDARLDAARVVLRGVSFGSFFAIQWAVGMGEACRGVVASYVAHEPGLHTLFEEASPTFKVRFMMMAGYEDEAAFDRFAAGFDVRPWARRLTAPLLVQAGERDELSPLVHTERLMELVPVPHELVVYQAHGHVLRGGGAVEAGESPEAMFADWMLARLAGHPARSRRLDIALDGRAVERAA